MKKIVFSALLALMASLTVFAQNTKNPKGLYRLKSFVFENGNLKLPGYSQYKYAADSVGLLVSFTQSRSATQWSQMQVEIRESYPLLNTGEKPQGKDGHGTQIFNVTDSLFCFKWYNERWPNMGNLNEFITEIYSKARMESEVVKAFELFENKIDAKANKFYGWWVRVGATANTDGTGKKMQVPVMWKAYGPDVSMVVNASNDGKYLRCSSTATIRYENDSTIHEIGHPCNIRWLNEDSHALTFVQENGKPLTEIWVRAGLPRNWQSVFNTDIETFRNGVDCMRDAVEAVVAGDLTKGEQFITEAINDKNVSIEVLCEGVVGMAFHLYTNKKQYKDCSDFCERQLQKISNYVAEGHEHNMFSGVNIHLVKVFESIATYRSGDQKKGLKMMEDNIAEVESEIERYKGLASASVLTNLLYYCNFMMYQLGYDILGTERTLLYMDFLTLMAPEMAAKNKSMILNCRGNCYLLDGDKEGAKKMWQQIKEKDADFFKNQPADAPLRQTFGE